MLRVVPIVEGHGEVAAVPLLIRRICNEMLGIYELEVFQPLRQPRSRIVLSNNLERYAEIAANKLRAASPGSVGVVLVLVDGDGDLPCQLGPALLSSARTGSGDQAAVCVVANLEFETWFVAAASSLDDELRLATGEPPEEPEVLRLRKKWIEDRFRGTRYSETLDQPRLTAKMDLALCRSRSPSFSKLCRDLERVVALVGLQAQRWDRED